MVGRQHRYPVSAIYKTIQGEGHFVGYPCVLVRLAGCSVVDCSIRKECDEAPWKAKETLPAWEIAFQVWLLQHSGIVLITGGEPTDHDLIPLIDCLRGRGQRVHLETSGVRAIEGYAVDWLTVSPKTPDYVQRSGHALKVVARNAPNWDDVLALDVGTTFFHRYLQPLTASDRTTNLADVAAMVVSRENRDARWALSTQAHRGWGLP